MTTANSENPNDLRFQFDIIKSLAENVRVMNETQTRMLERLARIEAREVNEIVTELKSKVDRLERLEDRREGESAAKSAFLKWWPVIGSLLMVIWIIGRSTGFFHVPEPPKQVSPVAVSKGI